MQEPSLFEATLLRPIAKYCLWDYNFSVPQRQPIKIEGWIAPTFFVGAEEAAITVDGTNIHTTVGTTTVDQLASFLSQTKSTNKLFRVFINSYARTSAEQFYNVVSIAHVEAEDILWDINNVRNEQNVPHVIYVP